uniref:Uncharacterized protein n=1 Tax=Arabidopsis thaliana TaxID=3702 RepID=Q56YS0_ARATH|nr:hypothetical protein [Arabidopsis thaliana]
MHQGEEPCEDALWNIEPQPIK